MDFDEIAWFEFSIYFYFLFQYFAWRWVPGWKIKCQSVIHDTKAIYSILFDWDYLKRILQTDSCKRKYTIFWKCQCHSRRYLAWIQFRFSKNISFFFCYADDKCNPNIECEMCDPHSFAHRIDEKKSRFQPSIFICSSGKNHLYKGSSSLQCSLATKLI